MSYEIEFAHELDISWLIALWFAIHGGDPSPEGGVLEVSEETYALANGLVENLQATYGRYGARRLSDAELEARLSKAGFQLVSDTAQAEGEKEQVLSSGPVSVGSSCWILSFSPERKRCWKPFW